MDSAYKLLREIGMRPQFLGYEYLAYGITLVRKNRRYLQKVTGHLYVEISIEYGSSSPAVESAMRRAVVDYWNLPEHDTLSKVVGRRIYTKPTVSELIAILAEHLCFHPEL